jgi:hypothetical protein
MKRTPLAVLVLAAVSPFSLVPAFAAEGAGEVMLSSGGLAEIVRHVSLGEGETVISLAIPVEQTDDVLKSLIVADPAGAVASVTIDGANAVDEAFRRLPFTRADLASVSTLAAALVGFEATIDDGAGHKDSGVILGVGKVKRPSEGEAVEVPAVTLKRSDGSFSDVLLGPGAGISFADATVQARVATAMTAVRTASAQNQRTVRIETTGHGARTVDLSYVVAAPVWKAAYRIVPAEAGKYRVQGWAVLENGTGDDWKDVRLTLNSSNPVALKQRLSDMYWRDRRDVPIMLPGGAVEPLVDTQSDKEVYDLPEGEADLPMAAPAPAMAGMVRKGLDGAFAASRGPEAAATESDTGISFTLPEPVTLAAGGTLTVPIIDADVAADLVSMWRSGIGPHPQAAIFLDNTTGNSVPPGIFTVYGDGGYLGDAQVAGIPPGEKRFAAFAADAKTTVSSEQTSAETVTGLKAGDGVLHVSRKSSWTTTYHVVAPKTEPRTVMIDHNRIGEATITTDGEVVSTDPGALRVRKAIKAGETADIKVTEERVTDDAVAFDDSTAETLLFYASTKGIDPATAGKLKSIAALKGKLADLDKAVDRANNIIGRMSDEQARLRANLAAVPATSDSAKTYLGKLDRTEKEIEKAEGSRADAQGEADKARAAYQQAIASF